MMSSIHITLRRWQGASDASTLGHSINAVTTLKRRWASSRIASYICLLSHDLLFSRRILQRSKYPIAKPKSGENCVLHYL